MKGKNCIKAKYVVVIATVNQTLWIRKIMTNLSMNQEDSTQFFVENQAPNQSTSKSFKYLRQELGICRSKSWKYDHWNILSFSVVLFKITVKLTDMNKFVFILLFPHFLLSVYCYPITFDSFSILLIFYEYVNLHIDKIIPSTHKKNNKWLIEFLLKKLTNDWVVGLSDRLGIKVVSLTYRLG